MATAGKGLCLGVTWVHFCCARLECGLYTDHLGVVLQVRREQAFLGSKQVYGISVAHI